MFCVLYSYTILVVSSSSTYCIVVFFFKKWFFSVYLPGIWYSYDEEVLDILVVVYTSQAAYILYDEKCREHGCIHFAYGEVPGAWLHTFYMMKSASSMYKITVRGSCTKIVWRFSSIPYCCFGVKYRYSVITVPVQRNYDVTAFCVTP